MRVHILIFAAIALAAAGCTKNVYLTQSEQTEVETVAGDEAMVEEALPPGIEVLSVELAKLDGTVLALDKRPLPLRMDVLVKFKEAVEEGEKPVVQEAFALKPEEGVAVEGGFEWNSESTLMTFTPARNLNYQTTYNISIAAKPIGDFTTMVNGDVDGAGAADVLVGSGKEDKAYLIRGEDLAVKVIAGSPTGSKYGSSVAIIGDVNNDGFADIAVSASNFESYAGKVFIYSGSNVAKGDMTPIATISGEKAGAMFGWSLAGVGDVDGDGYWDLLVGAPYFEIDPGDSKGKIYLYGGKSMAGGSPSVQKAVIGQIVNEKLGEYIATAGDIDGDAIPDFAVKHRAASGLAVLVFSGKDLDAAPVEILSPAPVVSFGSTIASVPDIDADGLGELLIGAPGGVDAPGRVYLYLGKDIKGGAPVPLKTIIEESVLSSSNFGGSVESLRLDQGAALIVGALEPMDGAGFVYGYNAAALAAEENPKSSYSWIHNGGMNLDRFGSIVARVGDINGDKVDDFAVCSPKRNDSVDKKGKVSIFSGATPSAPAFHNYSPAEGFCSSLSGLSP